MFGVQLFQEQEPLRGDCSLFTFKSLGVPGTHFIKLKRIKAESNLEPLTLSEPRPP